LLGFEAHPVTPRARANTAAESGERLNIFRILFSCEKEQHCSKKTVAQKEFAAHITDFFCLFFYFSRYTEYMLTTEKPLEKNRRSVTKSATYRTLSISVDSIVAYFFTRDAVLTLGIVLLVNGYSTLLYYLHERVWAHIKWGREEKIDAIQK
jgi:uncharacterized membrane protein